MHGLTCGRATLLNFNNNLFKRVKIAVNHTVSFCNRMKLGGAQRPAVKSANVTLHGKTGLMNFHQKGEKKSHSRGVKKKFHAVNSNFHAVFTPV